MFKIEFDDALIDAFAEKVAERAYEKLNKKFGPMNELPTMLTRSQLKEVLQIKETKVSELLNRPDFPVFREAGVLVPTHRLFQWIDRNTSWVKDNTKLFKQEAM